MLQCNNCFKLVNYLNVCNNCKNLVCNNCSIKKDKCKFCKSKSILKFTKGDNHKRSLEMRGFLPKYKTDRGEMVRSKFERDFANCLYQNKINYVYEPSINADFLIDFFIPRLQKYVELWGNINAKYDRDKERKIIFFKENNLSFIEVDYELYKREGIKDVLREIGLLPKKRVKTIDKNKLNNLLLKYKKTTNTNK